LRSFTADPHAVAAYGPLETEDGRVVNVETLRPAKEHFLAKLSGIRDRGAAERLTGLKLYVPRERLPEPDQPDEFYHADLVGLLAADPTGKTVGTVVAVHNFGAGDLIELRPPTGRTTELLPFNETTVPVVDVAAGRLVIDRRQESPPSRLAGKGDEATPSRVRGKAAGPLTGTAAGSRQRQSTLSDKRRG
jgi:16S rRNA processing protein RimM